MMHKAWSGIEEVPYCFSRSSIKFQGDIALKIIEFDSNWAFPECNSSLNSPMAMKCCTKLETAKKRCLIVFQGHPSNFKVTRDKTSPIFTQIGRFRTIGRSQLSNPSDLPCYICILFFYPLLPSVPKALFVFSSLWLSDAIWRQGSRSTLVQVMAWCTKPLPETMLTYHQKGPVMFIWGQFRSRCHSHQSLKLAWKLFF